MLSIESLTVVAYANTKDGELLCRDCGAEAGLPLSESLTQVELLERDATSEVENMKRGMTMIKQKDPNSMTLDQLKTLINSWEFHHATYRNRGTVWEGLWIYRNYDGARGFEPDGVFNCYKGDDPDLEEAYRLLKAIGHGHSVGSYGKG